jgi:hypothetical protein
MCAWPLFPAPISNAIPDIGEVLDYLLRTFIWLPIARIVAKYVLHLPGDPFYEPSGSGDTLFDYVRVLSCLLLATVISALWSYASRRSSEHLALASIFRTWLRYTLASFMLTYGLDSC